MILTYCWRRTKSCTHDLKCRTSKSPTCNFGLIDLRMDISNKITINWTRISYIKKGIQTTKQAKKHKSQHHSPLMLNVKWWTSIGCTQIIQRTYLFSPPPAVEKHAPRHSHWPPLPNRQCNTSASPLKGKGWVSNWLQCASLTYVLKPCITWSILLGVGNSKRLK